MATRAGELVAQAERHAWDLAVELQGRDLARPGEDVKLIGSRQVAAWPRLAASGSRCLEVLPLHFLDRGGQNEMVFHLRHIAGLAGWRAAGTAAPDERLVHMTKLLGGTADLLTGVPAPADYRDVLAIRDRVASILATSARFTRACTDYHQPHSSRASMLRSLDAIARCSTNVYVTRPGERGSRLEDVLVPDRSGDLPSVLAQWQAEATRTLVPESAASSTIAVQAVATDMAVILRATATTIQAAGHAGLLDPAAAREAVEHLGRAMSRWVEAARAWTPKVTAGGPRSPEQVQASRQLHDVVQVGWRDNTGWRTPDQLAATIDVRQATRDLLAALPLLEQTARQYAATVETLVRSGVLLTPARALPRGELAVEHLTALTHGRWVPLPPTAPEAERLTQSARDVGQGLPELHRSMEGATRPLIHRAAERSL